MRVRICAFCKEFVEYKYKLILQYNNMKAIGHVNTDGKDICPECAIKRFTKRYWDEAQMKFKNHRKDARGKNGRILVYIGGGN